MSIEQKMKEQRRKNHEAMDLILKSARSKHKMGYLPPPRGRPIPPTGIEARATKLEKQYKLINDKLDLLIQLIQPSETEEKLRK